MPQGYLDPSTVPAGPLHRARRNPLERNPLPSEHVVYPTTVHGLQCAGIPLRETPYGDGAADEVLRNDFRLLPQKILLLALLLRRLLRAPEGRGSRSAFTSRLTHLLAAPSFDALTLGVDVGVQAFLLSHRSPLG